MLQRLLTKRKTTALVNRANAIISANQPNPAHLFAGNRTSESDLHEKGLKELIKSKEKMQTARSKRGLNCNFYPHNRSDIAKGDSWVPRWQHAVPGTSPSTPSPHTASHRGVLPPDQGGPIKALAASAGRSWSSGKRPP